jgi:glutamine synthetase
MSQVQEPLPERCREAIDIVVASSMHYKAIVKEKLVDALIALKQKNYEKAEEIVKDLLIFLDL